jgi:DNA polymerase-3 subunit delta'
MHIKPSENRQLFGMNDYFYEITKLYNEKKMPNKILLSGKKGLGKSTLAYHIINYILSLNEDYKYDAGKLNINKKNKSYKLIQNNSHPNFFLIDLIDDKKSIDIAQVREMITYTNKSSFNNMHRFILIDKIENLNKNSVNALLKIIEEPNDGIFFILINNNEKTILPTLKSRCLTFNINFTFNESINTANRLLDRNILDLINTDIINYYATPGEIINLVNVAEEKNIDLLEHNLKALLKLLIDNGYYKKDKFVKKIIIDFIELFFLKEYQLSVANKSLLTFYHNFLNKIHNVEKFNLDEESLFLEFKSKLLNG